MYASDFESYSKEWYALPPGGEVQMKDPKFGTMLCYKHGNVNKNRLLFITDFAKPLHSYAPLFCCI